MPKGGLLPALAAMVLAAVSGQGSAAEQPLVAGTAAYGDWKNDAVGKRRLIRPSDLPPPYASRSASNGPSIVARPHGAMPQVPPGFMVEEIAGDLNAPRLMRTAPDGTVFLAETGGGRIRILRSGAGGAKQSPVVFAEGLEEPFGLAFYPPGPDPHYLYVATTNQVMRFPYEKGDTKARGKAEIVVPSLPEGGHRTRDVLFSPDGKRMFVAVGSGSNDATSRWDDETNRADILEFTPDGKGEHPFATGLRNPVEMAVHPETGDLWTVVNERDELGDNLPPDYATTVREGAFYGWPWYYIGPNQDPRHKGEHPELRDRVVVPDVLIQPHSAPLGLAVYTGQQFPAEYRNDIFVALHGSWNRSTRTGYKLVRLRLKQGKPTGEYDDFMIGFVTPDGNVWGRPVGVAVAGDGSLLVSDDAGGRVWRISYSRPR